MEERRLAVIVFTDIVGYSRMVQTDERLALELLEEHNRIVGQLIDGKGGQTLKTAGDIFLASFESAGAAVAAAAGIQQALAVRNEDLAEERQLHVRIGIHAGDVVFTDDPAGGRDVLGDGVNVASRVEAQAGGGEVFVSHDVFSITYDRVPFGYGDVGIRDLKNISRPIHIYELLWDPARQSEADAQPPRAATATGSSRSGRIGFTVAAIAVIAAAAVIIFHSSPVKAPLAERPALAVLGIDDRTGDADTYLGRIAHDAIEQYFYEFQPIRLVSPLRVPRARRELGLHEAASDLASIDSLTSVLDLRLAATGQLSRRGDQLHFTASLYDLADEGTVLVRRSWTAEDDSQLLALVDSACTAFQQRLADVFGFETEDFRIARVGDVTTRDLEAYAHFVRSHDLTYAGFLDEGAAELIKATQIDTGFTLAYSITACALSFDKQDSLSGHYFNLAVQHADDHLLESTSLEALIFQGNTRRGAGDAEGSCSKYQLAMELYPDEREGYLYHELCQQYLVAQNARNADDADALQAALEGAIEDFEVAASLSPGFFPIYYDWAQVIQELDGTEAAVRILSSYVREYGDGPGVNAARRQLAQLRGGG